MDELTQFNKERWEELSRAGISYSKPWLDLTKEIARLRVDPEGVLGNLQGRDVLCLAAGGGQQSAALALLGAHVTVLDLSDEQLNRDIETVGHYGFEIRAIQGDIRDLSALRGHTFDLVWHGYSINFVPDAFTVFRQVSSVMREKGQYRLHFANPFVFGLWLEKWTEHGYPLGRPYTDGPFHRDDPYWSFSLADGGRARARAPKEFVHTLSAVVNALISNSFTICGVWEDRTGNIDAEPGSWEHLKAVAPPWLTVFSRYFPEH
jgi:SAM-dependent methyltransferase